jgi:ATP-dependent Lon protease|tara:strand:+ start:165 stop:407 length:243 start_codon:yes stop_codon:yes gene_type:complete
MEAILLELAPFLSGPAAAVIVALYMNRQFISFTNNSINRILDDAEKDRELFKEAITKIDQRLYFLEEQMKDIKSELRRRE